MMSSMKAFAFTGGEWVIYLLWAASIATFGIMLERWLLFRQEKRSAKLLGEKVRPHLESGDLSSAEKTAQGQTGAVRNILLSALTHSGSTAASLEERIKSVREMEEARLSSRLIVLGSLGSNAPFIGLFGTVLGVIKAFHDLSISGGAGPEVVMAGLSEALIATAVGLCVAIPSVITFNYFTKQVEHLMTAANSMSALILAYLKDAPAKHAK